MKIKTVTAAVGTTAFMIGLGWLAEAAGEGGFLEIVISVLMMAAGTILLYGGEKLINEGRKEE